VCRRPAAGSTRIYFLDKLIEAFNAAHLRTFGYNYAGLQKVELVNFCVSGFGLIERPTMAELAVSNARPTPKETRRVYFDRFTDTPVYDRATLPSGFKLKGPAIIEEFGSTTVVFPGQKVEVDRRGILIVCGPGS
jgi:N-methylhydantoinase A